MVHRRLLPVAALIALIAIGATVAVLSGLLGTPLPSGVAPSGTSDTAASPAPTASASPSPVPTPSPSPPPASSILDRTGIEGRLQAALERDQAAMAAPGMVATLLFADGHGWSGTAGVADLASGRALSVTTPFAVASISKTFLAAEVLALVDAGTLRLDASAAGLLPGVLVGGRPLDPAITIHELLDHTSGLRDFLIDRNLERAVDADPRHAWTPAETLAYAGKPVAPPGTGYHYANTNFVLLGLIVERLTGRTLAQEYRTRFLDPLGMTQTFYQVAERPTSRLPTAYRYTTNKLDETPVDVSDGTAVRPFTAITTAAGAAGSMAASAPDLARWATALYGGKILSSGALRAMIDDATVTSTLDPAYPYGLGLQAFEIDGRLSYGHSGRLVGARSAMRWFPDLGMAIVVLTNESRFDPGEVVADLLAIVAPRPNPMRVRAS